MNLICNMLKRVKKPNSISIRLSSVFSKMNIDDKVDRNALIKEIYGEDADYFDKRSFDSLKCQVCKKIGIKLKLERGFLVRIR